MWLSVKILPWAVDSMRFAPLVKDLAPPLLVRQVSRLLTRRRGQPALYLDGKIDAGEYSSPWASPWWLSISEQKLRGTLVPNDRLGYLDVLSCFLNTTTSECTTVLDWGGGTGFVYFALRDRLLVRPRWLVADNPRLAQIGRDFADAHRRGQGELEFVGNMPLADSPYDTLLVNTSFQYVESCIDILESLSEPSSCRRVALTRLLVSEGDSIRGFQVLRDKFGTSCTFHSKRDLVSTLARIGYRLVSDMPNFADCDSLLRIMSPKLRAGLGGFPSRDLLFLR